MMIMMMMMTMIPKFVLQIPIHTSDQCLMMDLGIWLKIRVWVKYCGNEISHLYRPFGFHCSHDQSFRAEAVWPGASDL